MRYILRKYIQENTASAITKKYAFEWHGNLAIYLRKINVYDHQS